MSDPTPTQMLYEGAHDAIDAFALLRKGLLAKINTPSMIELIDTHIDELEYAIVAHEREQVK